MIILWIFLAISGYLALGFWAEYIFEKAWIYDLDVLEKDRRFFYILSFALPGIAVFSAYAFLLISKTRRGLYRLSRCQQQGALC